MWSPIPDGPTRRLAWEAIDDIDRELADHLEPSAPAAERHEDPMLAGGRIGLALFYAYLEAARPGEGAGERAVAALDAAIEAMEALNLSPALYTGFTGVAWVSEHLGRMLFADEDDANGEVDEVLRGFLTHPGLLPPYELIRGGAGFGIYLLERLPDPGARELLSTVIDHLEATAEESADGCTWWTIPGWIPPHRLAEFPRGHFNLGVAHGVPGVLGFLAAAARAGLDDPRLPRLAEGVVRWLLSQRLPPGGDCVFPALLVPDPPPEPGPAIEVGELRNGDRGPLKAQPSRTAWCYGDLGIACVLLAAARAFERPDWEREAVALAHLSAGRGPLESRVVDACLCHGAAGNSHLFRRLHHATGDPVFERAASVWLERALALRRPGEGIGGYLNWGLTGEGNGEGWRAVTGFLTGAAGVGLALLAAVSEVEPAWDRVMLLSLPGGAR